MPKVSRQLTDESIPCPHCGYDVHATLKQDVPLLPRCPECGHMVSMLLVNLYREAAPVGVLWWIVASIPAISVLVLIVALTPYFYPHLNFLVTFLFIVLVVSVVTSPKCAIYRYRQCPDWRHRLKLSFPLWLKIMKANIMAIMIIVVFLALWYLLI